MWAGGPFCVLNGCPTVCGLLVCNILLGPDPVLLGSGFCFSFCNNKKNLDGKKKKEQLIKSNLTNKMSSSVHQVQDGSLKSGTRSND